MFRGYARHADGSTSCLTGIAGLADAWADPGTVLWLDLEAPSRADLEQLSKIIGLDPAAIEDCLAGEQRPRLDEFEDHVFLLFYGLRGVIENTDADEEIDPRKLAVFFSRRYLITVHPRPVLSVREIRERGARNPVSMLAVGVDDVLYRIIDRMIDSYILAVQGYETRIEALEERTLAGQVDHEPLREITDLRREFMDLRHLAISQRELLRPFANGDLEYLSPALEGRFRHVVDHLMQVIELTDALREQLLSVRDNYHTAIATRTNTTMQTLTIFASVLLPLSLIAGIYGMNVPLWPATDQPVSFWIIIVVMAAIAAGMLAWFRRQRWF
jgi:magnesium transporter